MGWEAPEPGGFSGPGWRNSKNHTSERSIRQEAAPTLKASGGTQGASLGAQATEGSGREGFVPGRREEGSAEASSIVLGPSRLGCAPKQPARISKSNFTL